ncbi:copper transporter [Jatrophihabitans sp. DSM 45814]
MISFRYHLVSIIGIFLAIALGVVIGTSALNGAVVGDLRRQVSDLKQSNASAVQANQTLQSQAGDADDLAKAFGTKIANSSLAKTNVVIVGAPGASSEFKDGLAAEVAAAGGKVTARIQLSANFTDPKRATDIRALATSGAHPVGLQLPTTDDAGTLAGSLLGFVLLGKGQATDLTQVLAGLGTLGMAKSEGANPAAGKVILLVAPGAKAASDPDNAAGKILLSMATQFAVTGPTVVVGDNASATQGGLVSLVRADSTAKQGVSTVDDGNTALGQLTTVLVAAEALAGRPGQFGTGAGVDALIPGGSS